LPLIAGAALGQYNMATFTKKKRKDGSTVYKADIRIKKDGVLVHRESSTFAQLKTAKEWARSREIELEKPGALNRQKHKGVTVGDILKWYRDSYKDLANFGRTKAHHIDMMIGFQFSETPLADLTSDVIINHIKDRRKQCGAATANNDLIWLRVALKTARPHFPDYPIDLLAVEDAAVVCRKHRLIAKAGQRERRPTPDEIKLLSDYFQRRDKRAQLPMYDIFWFAIHSARRQGEITRILFADNDSVNLTGLVRDAKHPTKKEGNHRRFKYTQEAWEIVEQQPKTEDGRIFPYEERSVSAAFTRACHANGIEDLRFHDLRHEATSRLFEAGYSIVEVQQFTLHESWAMLKRYTNLRPENVKLRNSSSSIPSVPPGADDQ
jgi:integrase